MRAKLCSEFLVTSANRRFRGDARWAESCPLPVRSGWAGPGLPRSGCCNGAAQIRAGQQEFLALSSGGRRPQSGGPSSGLQVADFLSCPHLARGAGSLSGAAL